MKQIIETYKSMTSNIQITKRSVGIHRLLPKVLEVPAFRGKRSTNKSGCFQMAPLSTKLTTWSSRKWPSIDGFLHPLRAVPQIFSAAPLSFYNEEIFLLPKGVDEGADHTLRDRQKKSLIAETRMWIDECNERELARYGRAALLLQNTRHDALLHYPQVGRES